MALYVDIISMTNLPNYVCADAVQDTAVKGLDCEYNEKEQMKLAGAGDPTNQGIGTCDGAISEDSARVCDAIKTFIKTGNAGVLSDIYKYEKCGLDPKLLSSVLPKGDTSVQQWKHSTLFSAIYYNSFGTKRPQDMVDAVCMVNADMIREASGEPDSHPSAPVVDDELEHTKSSVDAHTDKVFKNHVANSNVRKVTKDVLATMETEIKHALTGKVINTEVLLHEIYVGFIEPHFTRCEFFNMVKGSHWVGLVPREHLQCIMDPVQNRPINLHDEIVSCRKAAYKILLPPAFRTNVTDDTPLLDEIFDVLIGADFNTLNYIYDLVNLTAFIKLKTTDQVFKMLATLEEKAGVHMTRTTTQNNIVDILKASWTKIFCCSIWVNLMRNSTCGDGITDFSKIYIASIESAIQNGALQENRIYYINANYYMSVVKSNSKLYYHSSCYKSLLKTVLSLV